MADNHVTVFIHPSLPRMAVSHVTVFIQIGAADKTAASHMSPLRVAMYRFLVNPFVANFADF